MLAESERRGQGVLKRPIGLARRLGLVTATRKGERRSFRRQFSRSFRNTLRPADAVGPHSEIRLRDLRVREFVYPRRRGRRKRTYGGPRRLDYAAI